MEQSVVYSAYIYPTCLYTDLSDPPAESQVFVTGWGLMDLKRRATSDVLLQAQLKIVPLFTCIGNYQKENSQLTTGHLCAYDAGLNRDACRGDSGGPLNLVVNKTINKYRVVGIISAGFYCKTEIPGLYTRVAAYLSFIESIVWPNQ